MSVATKGLQE
jgi:hypothetical protein